MKIDRNQLLSELEEMAHIGLSFQESVENFFEKYKGKEAELVDISKNDKELKEQNDKLREVLEKLSI